MEKIKSIIRNIWQGNVIGENHKKNPTSDSMKPGPRLKALMKNEFNKTLQSGKIILSPEKSKQLLERLHIRIGVLSSSMESKKRNTIQSPTVMARWLTAAIVILIAGAIWRYNYISPASTVTVSTTGGAKENKAIVQSNNGGSIQRITLPDKSMARLSPGSSISYYASFDKGRRSISLSGKAFFDVAKDTSRPFTVFAKEISTTALGTSFMMSTSEQHKISVQLFEGKVVIRSTSQTFTMKELYLHAGQQFIINTQSRQFSVTPLKDSAGSLHAKNPMPAHKAGGAILEFTQEPLTKVLEKIGVQYNVQFKVRDDGIDNIMVTGKFLPSDSLQAILSMLGNINNLSFKKYNNKIEVARVR